jgi:hypothetical protein
MAAARKSAATVVAVTPFVSITDGVYRIVVAGEELEASDELVKAAPGHFEPKKEKT